MTEPTTDPENVTELLPPDLAEAEIDEADEARRDIPIEADPADVAEQRTDVPDDPADDEDR